MLLQERILGRESSQWGGDFIDILVGEHDGRLFAVRQLIFYVSQHPGDIEIGESLYCNPADYVLPFLGVRWDGLCLASILGLSLRSLNENLSAILVIRLRDSGAVFLGQKTMSGGWPCGGVPCGLPASVSWLRCFRHYWTVQHHHFRHLHLRLPPLPHFPMLLRSGRVALQ